MNQPFDEAIEAIITGNAATLTKLLVAHPDLIKARSRSDHKATLLHYVAANGVEDELQKSPENATEIARILIEAGAEVDALAETYGGGTNQTTLCLLVSSIHPAAAGVQPALVQVLCDAGAAVNGVADDGAPLGTALLFSYRKSVDMLARCGARIDNLLFAAGVGDLARVKSFLHTDGRLRPEGMYHGSHLPSPADEKSQVDLAFGLACYHLRIEVIRFLHEMGVDVNARSDIFGSSQTGLYWATHGFHTEEEERPVVAFLQSQGATS